jgi:hypothetical protein
MFLDEEPGRDGSPSHLINARRLVAALYERRTSDVIRATVTGRRYSRSIYEMACSGVDSPPITGSAYGDRTRAPALRGLCPNH